MYLTAFEGCFNKLAHKTPTDGVLDSTCFRRKILGNFYSLNLFFKYPSKSSLENVE